MYSLRFRDELPEPVARELDLFISALRGHLLEEHNEDGTHVTSERLLDFVPVGSIMPYAGPSAPRGWVLCDGSQLNRVTYKALFDIIGTTYGVGDGSTTFNIPDLRQRFPLGKAAAGTGSALGDTGGDIDHTHSVGDHTHTISSAGAHDHGGATGTDGDHDHTVSGTTSGPSDSFNPDANNDGITATSSSDGHTHDFSETTSSDGDHSHTI